MREWILAAHYAEKLASSNEFDEIKSFVEKTGTNRRLLAKQVGWDFVRPFDLIPKQRAFCEARPAEGGAGEQSSRPEKSLSFEWSTKRYFRRQRRKNQVAPKARMEWRGRVPRGGTQENQMVG